MPARSWPRLAAALLVLVVIPGCGGPGPGEPPDPATSTLGTPGADAPTRATSTDETPTDETPPVETTEPTESADAVAYVPWGPADPVIPEHYGQLARRNCDAAESASPDGAFWDAVFAVCRTLTEGEPWPELTTAPEPPETDNPHYRCLDAELADWVSAALAWHADNASTTPQVTYPDTGSACYLTAYDARQVPPSEDSTGPGPGEVTVAVILDSTYSVTSVSVDGSIVDASAYVDAGNDPLIGIRTVSIHVPAPDAAGQISIDLAMDQDGADRGTVTTTVEVTPLDSGVSPSPDLDPGASPSPDSVDGADGSDATSAPEGTSETSAGDDS